MQFAIYNIPLTQPEEALQEMNAFLRSHKLLQVTRELITVNGVPCWTFCVQYLGGDTSSDSQSKNEKVDYKKILPPPIFDIFEKMRTVRKKYAQEELVPPYVIFTDAELAKVAMLPEINEKTLLTIEGVGNKKVEKYGKTFLAMYNEVAQTPCKE